MTGCNGFPRDECRADRDAMTGHRHVTEKVTVVCDDYRAGRYGMEIALLVFQPHDRGGSDVVLQDPVTLQVRDLAGRQVRTLVEGRWVDGGARLGWDGCNDRGQPCAPGLYWITCQGAQSAAGRCLLLR